MLARKLVRTAVLSVLALGAGAAQAAEKAL